MPRTPEMDGVCDAHPFAPTGGRCSACSSACCRRSRLYWIAAEASSRSLGAALVDTLRRRRSSDSARREEAAPMAEEVATQAPVVKTEWEKTPRNAPCPCGSGKKFKHCHGQFVTEA